MTGMDQKTAAPDELSRVVTFANGKGGVGKTTCAVNTAGLAAAAGWHTLLIDLDPQGNVGHDLGYTWAHAGDRGQHLVDALVTGQPLRPVLTDVRPHLDVISGGEALDDLEDIVSGRARRNQTTHTLLGAALTEMTGTYDLIVIDTPPTRPTLLQLALAATRWIIVPTRADRSSIEGLRTLAAQIVKARTTNPAIGVLGAVLFDSGTAATVVRRNAITDIEQALDGAATMFESVIRHSESAAVDAREQGILAHELAEKVDAAEPYWKALREGRVPTRVPGSAPALAEDYVLFTQEVLTRIATNEEQEATA